MTSKLAALRRMPWRDRGLLLEAWVTLLCLNLGLRILPFRWLRSAIARAGRVDRAPRPDQRVEVERCWRLVRIAARHHVSSSACLARSMALRALLSRRGIETALRFGVQREGGDLAAHAWIEYGGRPIGEPEDVELRYLPLVPETSPAKGPGQ